MADGRGFLDELKRRHVWRVSVAYAVAGWLVVQVAAQAASIFHLPDWVAQFVAILLLVGYPVVAVLAWVFEITPEGIRRTEPADSPEARLERDDRAIRRKLDIVIIAVLVVAIAVLLGNQFVWHAGMRGASLAHAPATGQAAAAGASPLAFPAAAIPEKSVAVLPFVNESGKQDEQYFSDGLTEDLINALSQFDGLKVISRHSAFQFRASKDSSRVIGAKLGVAHLLEGSVRWQGEEVRITATLVNAADGSTLWSHQYDRPYQDLFALQDAITQAVADALKAKLMDAPGVVRQDDRPPGGKLAAYTAYQHGIAYAALGTEAGERQAIAAQREAIRLDGKYAAAYARLSMAWTGLAIKFPGSPVDVAHAKNAARKAATTALELDPDSSQAHWARAYLLLNLDTDWQGAEAEYRRALQLSPNDAAAQFGLGYVLATLGQNHRAVELTRQALASDPRHASWYNWLSSYLAAVGELDAARRAINTSIALQPGAISYHQQLAIIEVLRGDAKAAREAALREPPGVWHDEAIALALQIGPDRAAADAALERLVREHADDAPYQIAETYALRRDPDAMFKWLDRAWTSRDSGIAYLLSDPMVLRYRKDPRFAAYCRKVGLPTTTDAVPMPP